MMQSKRQSIEENGGRDGQMQEVVVLGCDILLVVLECGILLAKKGMCDVFDITYVTCS